jgi:hypothetical protein
MNKPTGAIVAQLLNLNNGDSEHPEPSAILPQTPEEEIRSLIVHLPGRPPAILDRDLAETFNIETKYLNKQVRSNANWFGEDYCFEATEEESKVQNLNLKLTYMPLYFSDYGCKAAAFVINSPEAIKMRHVIITAFTDMRNSALVGKTYHIRAYNFGQLVKDAMAYRLMKSTQMTPQKYKDLARYLTMTLKMSEIARLMDVTEDTVRKWRENLGQMNMFQDAKGTTNLFLE